MVSSTTRGTSIYVHTEKQSYKFQGRTSKKNTYKCMFNNCNSKIIKINYDCYRNTPHIQHNHTENGAKTFRRKIQRIFALRVMERLLKEKGKIDFKTAEEIIRRKAGKMTRNVLSDVKRRLTKKTKEKNTGTFITVEPVKLIPLTKIKNIKK